MREESISGSEKKIMCNNNIDRAFNKMKALSQKKGYLLFDDIQEGSEGLSVNEVDWLSDRLLTSGVEIFDDVPEAIKNGPGLNQPKEQGHPVGTLLFLKYKALNATGRRVIPKGFIVYEGSEYNEVSTDSCPVSIDKKRRQLMQWGKMREGVLTEDIQFSSPSTAAKVLIGNSVNGSIVWVDSNGYTLRQIFTENEK